MKHLPEWHQEIDTTSNPEIMLLTAEQDDEYECDAIESCWLSGMAVKKPTQSHKD